MPNNTLCTCIRHDAFRWLETIQERGGKCSIVLNFSIPFIIYLYTLHVNNNCNDKKKILKRSRIIFLSATYIIARYVARGRVFSPSPHLPLPHLPPFQPQPEFSLERFVWFGVTSSSEIRFSGPFRCAQAAQHTILYSARNTILTYTQKLLRVCVCVMGGCVYVIIMDEWCASFGQNT